MNDTYFFEELLKKSMCDQSQHQKGAKMELRTQTACFSLPEKVIPIAIEAMKNKQNVGMGWKSGEEVMLHSGYRLQVNPFEEIKQK
jgi:hypothetical protein